MSHTCFHFQFYVIIVYLTVHTAAVAAALSPLLFLSRVIMVSVIMVAFVVSGGGNVVTVII